jgi:hypothetical protein
VQQQTIYERPILRRWRLVCSGAMLALGLAAWPGSAAGQVTLAVQGDHFTVNGQPRFLTFISYFDAIDATNNVSDFRYLRQRGIDEYGCFRTGGPRPVSRGPEIR